MPDVTATSPLVVPGASLVAVVTETRGSATRTARYPFTVPSSSTPALPPFPPSQAGGATQANAGTAAISGWVASRTETTSQTLPAGTYTNVIFDCAIQLAGTGQYRFVGCRFTGGPTPGTGAYIGLVRASQLQDPGHADFLFCDFAPRSPSGQWNGLTGSRFTVDACYFSAVVDHMEVYNLVSGQADAPSGVLIQRCYADRPFYQSAAPDGSGLGPGGLSWPSSHDTHNDTLVQWEGGTGGLIRWNTVVAYEASSSIDGLGYPHSDGSTATRGPAGEVQDCLLVKPDVGAIDGLVIEENLFLGGNVGLNFADRTTSPARAITNVTVRNNRFGKGTGRQYAQAGIARNLALGVTSTGNLFEDGTTGVREYT